MMMVTTRTNWIVAIFLLHRETKEQQSVRCTVQNPPPCNEKTIMWKDDGAVTSFYLNFVLMSAFCIKYAN